MSVLRGISPRIVRGIRDSLPSGHFVGRFSRGDGPAELIPFSSISQALIATGSFATPDNLSDQFDTLFGTTEGMIIQRGPLVWQALSPGTANQLLASGGAAALNSWKSLSALIDAAIGSTRGAVLYRGASGWAILAPGSANTILTSAGPGADPAWSGTYAASLTLANGDILVGNGSNIAAAVAMSGDVTMTNAGVTSIKSGVALAGSPTTTTQTVGDNSTKIATTAFVAAAASGGGTGANPTATASDAAVNGVATTFMRSDAAPAVQKASPSVFGLAKVDGTSITAAAGVISAVFPTATTLNAVASADTTPGTTYGDVTGASVSLTAGSWMIICQAALTFTSNTSTCYIKLINSTDSADITGARISTSSAGFLYELQVVGFATIAATKTFKLQARHDGTGNWTVNRFSDGTIPGTGISAIRLGN